MSVTPREVDRSRRLPYEHRRLEKLTRISFLREFFHFGLSASNSILQSPSRTTNFFANGSQKVLPAPGQVWDRSCLVGKATLPVPPPEPFMRHKFTGGCVREPASSQSLWFSPCRVAFADAVRSVPLALRDGALLNRLYSELDIRRNNESRIQVHRLFRAVSFMPQRDRRIDLHGPPCGNLAGEQRD